MSNLESPPLELISIKIYLKSSSRANKYLRFIIIDSVNNTEDLEEEEIDALLIEKEQFWIGTLHTYPFGLNSAHDLHRKTRKNIPDD